MISLRMRITLVNPPAGRGVPKAAGVLRFMVAMVARGMVLAKAKAKASPIPKAARAASAAKARAS